MTQRLTVRERWLVRGVFAATVALAVVVVVLAVSGGGARTGPGCIDVTFPIAIGGQELHGCGTQARQLCAAVDAPGGTSGVAGRAVAQACRRAGLPVGSG